MPRFVILEHDHPRRHWDFMLESGTVLRTWRLTNPPLVAGDIQAEATFDHRLVYLDYEGPVSGGRGSVVRWDTGSFTWEKEERDRVAVRLEGERLHGLALLSRREDGAWSMHWTGDKS